MKKSRQSKEKKRGDIWIYLFLLAFMFSASTGAGYLYFKEKFFFDSSFIADIEARKSLVGGQQKKADSRLYASGAEDTRHGNNTQDKIKRKDATIAIVEDIIRKQVKPYDVPLLDLYMDREGIIYIDFGSELTKNFRGDVEAELGILTGLFTRIKTVVPGFTALKILVDSREIESFGGHIDISKPIGAEIANSR